MTVAVGSRCSSLSTHRELGDFSQAPSSILTPFLPPLWSGWSGVLIKRFLWFTVLEAESKARQLLGSTSGENLTAADEDGRSMDASTGRGRSL